MNGFDFDNMIKPGSVIVIRYEGPKGSPGMREMYLTLKMLNGQCLGKTTAVVHGIYFM